MMLKSHFPQRGLNDQQLFEYLMHILTMASSGNPCFMLLFGTLHERCTKSLLIGPGVAFRPLWVYQRPGIRVAYNVAHSQTQTYQSARPLITCYSIQTQHYPRNVLRPRISASSYFVIKYLLTNLNNFSLLIGFDIKSSHPCFNANCLSDSVEYAVCAIIGKLGNFSFIFSVAS